MIRALRFLWLLPLLLLAGCPDGGGRVVYHSGYGIGYGGWHRWPYYDGYYPPGIVGPGPDLPDLPDEPIAVPLPEPPPDMGMPDMGTMDLGGLDF